MKIKEMQKHFNKKMFCNKKILQDILIFLNYMINDIKLINKYPKFDFMLSILEIIEIKNKYIDLQKNLSIFSVNSVDEFINDCEEFLKSNNFKDKEENELYQTVREKINILSNLK